MTRLSAMPPEDRPLRVRITRFGVKLQFYHPAKPIPPFKINVPLEQWRQLIDVVRAAEAGGGPGEVLLGFSEQTLALHRIEAVEAAAVETPSSGLPDRGSVLSPE